MCVFFFRIGGATFTSDAIDLAYDIMTGEAATSAEKVVVLLTDGVPTPGREPCDAATKLRDADIKVATDYIFNVFPFLFFSTTCLFCSLRAL